MSHDQAGLLTQEEVEKLIMALGSGQDTFTENQVIQAVKWGEQARRSFALLEGVLSGDLVIGFDGDEMGFKLTDQGRKKARGNNEP